MLLQQKTISSIPMPALEPSHKYLEVEKALSMTI
jgi:hypothetical protein